MLFDHLFPNPDESEAMTQKPKTPAVAPVSVGHVPVNFPRDFDPILHSAAHIAGQIRGTETLSKGVFLQHAAVIVGCGGALLEGSPEPVGAVVSPPGLKDMSNEELATAIESAIAPQANAVGAFPWVILLPYIFEAVRRYLGF